MGRLGRGFRQPPFFFRGRNLQTTEFNFWVETDTAFPVGKSKQRTISTVTETDTAQSITRGVLSLEIGVATETDSAEVISTSTTKTLILASSSNTAIIIVPKKVVIVSTITEQDQAFTITQAIGPPTPPGDPDIWRVDILPLNSDVPLLVGAPVQSWMFNYVLNAPGAFEADLQLNHTDVTPAKFPISAAEIRVYRDDVLVWGGYLWAATASVTNYKMRIRGEGYFSRLRRRIIDEDLIKYNKDQADIAWQLIQFTQDKHGTIGISDGHYQTGVIIDHVYCATDLPVVGEAVEELADMDDSFDWWITPVIGESTNKVFRTPPPSGGFARRGSTKAVTLNQDNAISADYELDGSEMANRIWGFGSGDCNPPEFEAFATASISTHGELHDTQTYEDLDHLPSVKAHTREELRWRKEPREQVRIRMEERDYEWGSFDVGDIITVASNRGYVAQSKQMRVMSIQVNFDPENIIAFYEFMLDSVID